MTLSRWLRDYLYIPLGGNREGPARHLPEPHAHDGHRRALARRRLDVRRLGRDPRHGARVERWRRERPGFVEPDADRAQAELASLRDLPDRLLRVDLLPGGFVRNARDVIVRLFTAWGEPSPLVTVGVIAAIVAGIGSQYLPARVPLSIMARFSRLPSPDRRWCSRWHSSLTNSMGPEGVAPFIYFRF